MNIWDDFWNKKGKTMEWDQQHILNSSTLIKIYSIILRYFKKNKKNLKNFELLELGSGMGITSYFFAVKGIKVTLLDSSKEVESLIKEFYRKQKYKFIYANLFKFNIKKRYDIVSSFGLCEHFVGKQRKEVLQKHIALLKDKGIGIISVPYKYGLFYRLSKLFSEILGYWSFGIEIPFSKTELIIFAKQNKLQYEIFLSGFYSSAYDLFVRKPLKILGISLKRRFDNTRSIFDRFFGSGIVVVLKK